MDLSRIFKGVARTISANTPTILTATAVAGVVGTAVFAVQATPKAVQILEEEAALDAELLEKIKLTWRVYIPTVTLAAVTAACIVSLNSIHLRRNATLASAYAIVEKAATEYQKKVVEIVGEKKAGEIREAVTQERLDQRPVNDSQVIITGRGETLCHDSMSGRYFKSDIEELRRIENRLNHRLVNDTWVSLNELYSELGLENTKLGNELGWVPDNLIEFRYTTKLASDGSPCLVLDFVVDPRLDPYRN